MKIIETKSYMEIIHKIQKLRLIQIHPLLNFIKKLESWFRIGKRLRYIIIEGIAVFISEKLVDSKPYQPASAPSAYLKVIPWLKEICENVICGVNFCVRKSLFGVWVFT